MSQRGRFYGSWGFKNQKPRMQQIGDVTEMRYETGMFLNYKLSMRNLVFHICM